MLQKIEGKLVYVVEFDTLPDLPITWEKPEEEPYARCLQQALEQGVITDPGKYSIKLEFDGQGKKYVIYRVIE